MARTERVLVAGASGYVGRYTTRAFVRRGYRVRALARDAARLAQPGPFGTPAIVASSVLDSRDSTGGPAVAAVGESPVDPVPVDPVPVDPVPVEEVFVGELTRPETLDGLMDGIDIVFSSVGISRQRDGLTFEEVDYGCNHTLIEMAEAAAVSRFVYVSMQGADHPGLADLAITRAHERVVEELNASGLDHTVIRPCGYFSDMGALLSMARRGVVLLVGDGSNRMSPIHGRDLAEICVDATAVPGPDAGASEVVAGGPEVMTQREAAEMAFDVVARKPRFVVVPMGVARAMASGIGRLSAQFGDLAEFVVVAGEVDGVGPLSGSTTLRSYFEELAAS